MELPTIATIGSHSALQILGGAKQEGFPTLAIVKKDNKLYSHMGVADKTLEVDSYEQLLVKPFVNTIIVPHGSFVAYLGLEELESLPIPYYGNKKILRWESDRDLEREWLLAAGCKLPRIFKSAKDIDRPVIVKFHGAGGGKGYFLARDETDFNEKIRNHPGKKYLIQEYIIGVQVCIHFFYSGLTGELEIMSFDKRYESNVDSIGRISARDQIALDKVDPSYLVVGNVPIVVRESYLPRIHALGLKVIEQSKKIAPPGLFGPFCLETIFTPEEEIFVFEISARIVAGTNPYMNGSPYTWVKYGEPMSTGRRIAREIRLAIEQGRLQEVLG